MAHSSAVVSHVFRWTAVILIDVLNAFPEQQGSMVSSYWLVPLSVPSRAD